MCIIMNVVREKKYAVSVFCLITGKNRKKCIQKRVNFRISNPGAQKREEDERERDN